MKSIIFLAFFCPLLSVAQTTLPRFDNDTLYTSGGYPIYKGQTLQLANGTSAAGYFRFIKFHTNMARTDTYILQNSSIEVDKLKAYKYSSPDNNSIRISGTATYKDGKKADVDFIMNFERVIEAIDGLAAELTVPEEFRTKRQTVVATAVKKQPATSETKKQAVPDEFKKLLVADEIKKLFDLYKAGALTLDEYEARKKKLLEQ